MQRVPNPNSNPSLARRDSLTKLIIKNENQGHKSIRCRLAASLRRLGRKFITFQTKANTKSQECGI